MINNFIRGGEGDHMELICESKELNIYLSELNEVDYSNSVIQEKISELFKPAQSEIEKTKAAFKFVRDEISHSCDIQSTLVTCKASETLSNKEGICYAKSNVLAALLRSQGIPTGFCYQRLMLSNTPEKGYCIHALNAVFLKNLNKWIRLDARGNKKGIDAQFLINEEKLAYTVQGDFGEIDYPIIYAEPHPKITSTLRCHSNALEMCRYHLPEDL